MTYYRILDVPNSTYLKDGSGKSDRLFAGKVGAFLYRDEYARTNKRHKNEFEIKPKPKPSND